jgi:hypothetical protein
MVRALAAAADVSGSDLLLRRSIPTRITARPVTCCGVRPKLFWCSPINLGGVAAFPGPESTGHRSRKALGRAIHGINVLAPPPIARCIPEWRLEERRLARREWSESTPLAGALALHGVSGKTRKPLGLNP